MTERELAELLQQNPDLGVDGGVVSYALDKETFENRVVEAKLSTPKLTEHELQARIIERCNQKSILIDEYSLIFAIPNGGHRHPAVAAMLKAEGVKAGVPDLMLPVARKGYNGAFWELKVSPNKPTAPQLQWASKLKAEGYYCAVIFDSVEAGMFEIESYLEG